MVPELLSGVGLAAAAAYAVRGRSAQLLAPSVHRGPRGRRAIALTFDDGPSPSTPELLAVLARHGVVATFFQCGMHVRRLPSITREVPAAGHELGNHTDTHPLLCRLSPARIDRELRSAQEAMQAAAGVSPRLFRAPYGVRWFGLRAAQRQLGLLGVMWTVIARDWALSAHAVAARLLRGATPGAILCLHDGRVRDPRPDIRPTLDAVRHVVPALLDQGYEFRTVSQLLCPTT